jgi:hypothetical protein
MEKPGGFPHCQIPVPNLLEEADHQYRTQREMKKTDAQIQTPTKQR